jgi:hypothetical protein
VPEAAHYRRVCDVASRGLLEPFQCVQKINCAHNPNSFIPLEPQEIEITGHNQVGPAGKSAGEDVIIIRVFLDKAGQTLRLKWTPLSTPPILPWAFHLQPKRHVLRYPSPHPGPRPSGAANTAMLLVTSPDPSLVDHRPYRRQENTGRAASPENPGEAIRS